MLGLTRGVWTTEVDRSQLLSVLDELKTHDWRSVISQIICGKTDDSGSL